MQELQVKITQAQVEIIDREKFEQNINEVVAKYQNYTVTASTIKDDKQVLANLRKLDKQVSDERIRNKKLLSEPADEFDKYIKQAIQPLKDIIDKIDTDVKEFEAHQKTVRLDTVKAYISNKSAEYMIDPRVFDEKATEYIKASDFMADGMTLKKATMKSLDDMVTFEFQKQQELEKSKSAISGLCAEYGMTASVPCNTDTLLGVFFNSGGATSLPISVTLLIIYFPPWIFQPFNQFIMIGFDISFKFLKL